MSIFRRKKKQEPRTQASHPVAKESLRDTCVIIYHWCQHLHSDISSSLRESGFPAINEHTIMDYSVYYGVSLCYYLLSQHYGEQVSFEIVGQTCALHLSQLETSLSDEELSQIHTPRFNSAFQKCQLALSAYSSDPYGNPLRQIAVEFICDACYDILSRGELGVITVFSPLSQWFMNVTQAITRFEVDVSTEW